MRVITVSMLIPLAVACTSSKADQAAPTAVAPIASSAGPAATLPTATPTAAAPPVAPGPKLGPIPLAHAVLDFAALFPGDQVTFAPAEPGEGSMPPSIVVSRPGPAHDDDRDTVVIASLHGKRITRLEVFAPGIATPLGVEVGASAAAIARVVPDATCAWGGSARGVLCSSARAPAFTYQFDALDWGEDLASAPKATTLKAIIWDAPKGAKLTIKRRPPKAKTDPAEQAPAADDDEGDASDAYAPVDEPITSAECEQLTAKLVACGTTDAVTRAWLSSVALGAPVTPAAVDAKLAAWKRDPSGFCGSWSDQGGILGSSAAARAAALADCGQLRVFMDDTLQTGAAAGTGQAARP